MSLDYQKAVEGEILPMAQIPAAEWGAWSKKPGCPLVVLGGYC
jgi:hypothetical protein